MNLKKKYILIWQTFFHVIFIYNFYVSSTLSLSKNAMVLVLTTLSLSYHFKPLWLSVHHKKYIYIFWKMCQWVFFFHTLKVNGENHCFFGPHWLSLNRRCSSKKKKKNPHYPFKETQCTNCDSYFLPNYKLAEICVIKLALYFSFFLCEDIPGSRPKVCF